MNGATNTGPQQHPPELEILLESRLVVSCFQCPRPNTCLFLEAGDRGWQKSRGPMTQSPDNNFRDQSTGKRGDYRVMNSEGFKTPAGT